MAWLSRVDSKNTHGWQFRIERKEITERKFFRDSKFGSNEKALAAAKEHRNQFLEAATELSIRVGASRHTSTTLPASNTSGILGVNRSHSKERNGMKFPLWQTTYILPDGGIETKKSSVNKYGEQVALLRSIEFRKQGMINLLNNEEDIFAKEDLQNLINSYEDLQDYIKSLSQEAEIFFFLSTLNNSNILNTTKQEFINARIGQERFRKEVLKHWNYCCAVTGTKMFIVAGHIKPWRVAKDEERLDVYNGIALSPNYDKAFDGGYISFDEQGKILIAPELIEEAHLLSISKSDKIEGLNFLSQKYLEYHRRNIFKGNHRTSG